MKSILPKGDKYKVAMYNEDYEYYEIDGIKFYLQAISENIQKLRPIQSTPENCTDWLYGDIDAELVGGAFTSKIVPVLNCYKEIEKETEEI